MIKVDDKMVDKSMCDGGLHLEGNGLRVAGLPVVAHHRHKLP